MKTHVAIVMSLVLAHTSFAMDQMTIGISRVFDAPNQDSQAMTLEHKESQETIHADRNIVLADKDFKEMALVEGDDVAILITLTDEGAKKFAELTREMKGKRLAISASNRLLSAPVVQQEITGGSILISGNLTKEQAEEMIVLFKRAKQG